LRKCRELEQFAAASMSTTMNTNTIDQSQSPRCPICGTNNLHTFLELKGMPAQDGVVYATAEAAKDAPTGDISLGFCRDCCYIGNMAFDADKVGFSEYRYSQHHSPKYQKHVDYVIAKLIDKRGIRKKTVVDVGCGDGYFLRKICAAGDNRGTGIDPSAIINVEQDIGDGRLTMIRDYYSGKYAHHRGDLVSCRHVIDELSSPRDILQTLSGSLADDATSIIYLEIPNAIRTLEQKLVWNIGYAKRSWFTAASIKALFGLCGLSVLEIEELFDGEYLGVTGKRSVDTDNRAHQAVEMVGPLVAMLGDLERHFKSEVARWTARVAQLRERREKTAIWGAGMRGINFLSRFGNEAVFQKVVDINPERQGVYLPCSASYVESPDVLKAFSPDRIVLSNPNYKEEIRHQLADMGINCELESL
jgi:SAM-dependent methyltransferase